ncbi:MAG: penicillin-binding protein 2 [Anaerolineae bacterium]|nr:penicillin-binding protein 2 [Anaerolineae bacterium]
MTSQQYRLYLILLVFGLAGFVIIYNLARIQVSADAHALRSEADQNYMFKTEIIKPERGKIYDRYGNILAGNKEIYEVGISLDLKHGNEETIARDVSNVLGLPYEQVLGLASTEYNKGSSEYIVLKNYVEADAIVQLNELKSKYEQMAEASSRQRGRKNTEKLPSLDGLTWKASLKREYPEGKLAANVLGFYPYQNPKDKAHFGVEEQYDELLTGIPVEVRMPVEPRKAKDLPDIPPGTDIILTIDRKIQEAVEQILDHAVEKNLADSGTAIVMDPKTGEVLAMAVTPRIDPNEYWKAYEVLGKESYNRAIDSPYEPGSVFKVITMAAALDSGVVAPDTIFIDTGVFPYGGYDIYNWDRGAWGPQTMIGCMQYSLNVCLSWIAAERLGAQRFYSYLKAFGVGHRTNIDLAGEAVWPLSVPGDEYWSDVNLVTNSFGQGLSVSPIFMSMAVSAIANDGKMMAPHIVSRYIQNGQVVNISPRQIGTPISAETARTLTEMLAISVEGESYQEAQVEGYRIAGKTGTAEIPQQGGYTTNLTNASFVGWGPTDNPRFLIYIWIEKPRTAPWGSVVASPIFRQIAEKLVVLMDIPPDAQRKQLALTQ